MMLPGTIFEYKFITAGGWNVGVESGAELGGSCDWNPDDNNNNYGGIAEADPTNLPTYVLGVVVKYRPLQILA